MTWKSLIVYQTVGGGETATSTAPNRAVELRQEPATTVVKSLSLSGVDGELSAVDVKNGKIVRIRPLHYDWKYPKEWES